MPCRLPSLKKISKQRLKKDSNFSVTILVMLENEYTIWPL